MNTTPPSASSREFAGILKSWREHRKHSQLELSLSAGISQRHLSFLETGKSRPSRAMVLNLAETLELPLRARNSLLLAAGYAPAYRETGLDAADMTAVQQALTLMLEHHAPYPAIVLDGDWNIINLNGGATQLFGQFVDPVNVWADIGSPARHQAIWLCLHERGLKPFTVNWQEVMVSFLARTRRALVDNPQDDDLRHLAESIEAALPEDAAPGDGPDPLLTMELARGDLRLKLFTTVTTFGTPQDVTLQELRIESFYPADDVTRRWFLQ